MNAPERAYRPDRLRSGWALVKAGKVRPLGGSQFLVAGNVERVYAVDLDAEQPCYCRDQEFRGTAIRHHCKHVCACKLAQFDPSFLDVVAGWLDTETKEVARA